MSFDRDDYRNVFELAKATYLWFEGRGRLESHACHVMDMCERVIGQQSDRPEGSRRGATNES